MKTQICLLSGELMPNVIGVLQAKATQVLPVVTRESQSQVEAFERALKAAGSTAEVLDSVLVLPYDLEDCLSTLRRKIGALMMPEINWTAGTKVMSFAARRLAEEFKLTALYVNTTDRQLYIENLSNGVTSSEMIDSAKLGLTVLAHIAAAGHRVDGATTLESFHQRCMPASELVKAATFIMDARSWERHELFKLASADTKSYTPTRLGEDFLDALLKARLIQLGRRPGEFFLSVDTLLHPFHLQSHQEQNAAFLTSLYLEVFIWSQIKERSGVDDVAWNVVLNPGEKGRVAELDVTVASEGRFLVIECKTNLELRQLADVIEEQYARTRRIGRLFGRWMLYVHRFRSDFDSSHKSILSSQEAKANEYGGKLLWHDDLADLPIIAATFLNESKPPL